jgi:hypothetical protein
MKWSKALAPLIAMIDGISWCFRHGFLSRFLIENVQCNIERPSPKTCVQRYVTPNASFALFW